MSTKGDKRTFRNEDLILKVTENIDPKNWDEGKYEALLDELCGYREYQKEAIRTTLRFLLGGKYANRRALAKENFDDNTELQERYGSWAGMEKQLQLPEQLACSVDQATGTGKSYVLYGLALILLAEGGVARRREVQDAEDYQRIGKHRRWFDLRGELPCNSGEYQVVHPRKPEGQGRAGGCAQRRSPSRRQRIRDDVQAVEGVPRRRRLRLQDSGRSFRDMLRGRRILHRRGSSILPA